MSETNEPLPTFLAKVPNKDLPEVNPVAIFTDVNRQLFSCVPQETVQQKIALQQAMSGNSKPLQDEVNKQLHVIGFISHKVEVFDNEADDTRSALRCVLICTGGEVYSCVSDGVVASLRDICAIFGIGPWNPPLIVQVSRPDTRAGFKTMKLSVCQEYAAAVAKKASSRRD